MKYEINYQDFERIYNEYQEGIIRTKIAANVGCSYSTVCLAIRIIRHFTVGEKLTEYDLNNEKIYTWAKNKFYKEPKVKEEIKTQQSVSHILTVNDLIEAFMKKAGYVNAGVLRANICDLLMTFEGNGDVLFKIQEWAIDNNYLDYQIYSCKEGYLEDEE